MELADQIGLHFTFVSSVERGGAQFELRSLLRLADGLGVNPADLVEDLHWSEET